MKHKFLSTACFLKAVVFILGFSAQVKAFDVMVLGPLSVVATVAAPLVTAYAAPQTSAIYNTCNLISPIINTHVSTEMDSTKFPFVSTITTFRNLAEFGMGATAAYYAWSHCFTGESSSNTIVFTLTTVNAMLTTVGTIFMYRVNFSNWNERNIVSKIL